MTAPLPPGLPLTLDPGVRVYGGGRVLAGAGRIMRLSAGGPAALRALAAGRGGAAERRLGRRLVDAGMAHPRPARQPADATVVIPVRDRAHELDRCLAATTAPVVVVDDGSREPDVAAVAARHGARVVRRERAGGPAAARNAGLRLVEAELVAFLDSDCVPPPGWIEGLAGHFADPLVAAVAPRVAPLPPAGRLRSPLDMGPRASPVGPGRPVPYVPSAALVVRRAALGLAPFDTGLRHGEDVDLVWRLHDAGWRVRYDPAVVVWHREPRRLAARLARRFRYGTSAAPLARRHPGRLAPVVLPPWPALAAALLPARRPGLAAAAALAPAVPLARRLRAAGVPARAAPVWTARSVALTWRGLARAVAQLGAPLALALATRRAEALALLARRDLLEEMAYGAGVYAGCLRARTIAPLVPRSTIRGSPTI